MGRGGFDDLLVAFDLQKMPSRDDQCNHKSFDNENFRRECDSRISCRGVNDHRPPSRESYDRTHTGLNRIGLSRDVLNSVHIQLLHRLYSQPVLCKTHFRSPVNNYSRWVLFVLFLRINCTWWVCVSWKTWVLENESRLILGKNDWTSWRPYRKVICPHRHLDLVYTDTWRKIPAFRSHGGGVWQNFCLFPIGLMSWSHGVASVLRLG